MQHISTTVDQPQLGEPLDASEAVLEPSVGRVTPQVWSERFPLKFPKVRWVSLDAEEQQRVTNAQAVLDALKSIRVRTLGTLESDTELDQDDLGPALGVLDEMGLIEWDEDTQEEELIVTLVATPEEHLKVCFPDGESRWIFVARPLVEPNVPRKDLN